VSTLEQPGADRPAIPNETLSAESRSPEGPAPALLVYPSAPDTTDSEAVRLARLHAPALEAVPDAVFVCDPQGAILHSNRAARKVCGFDPQDGPGRAFPDLVAASERRDLAERFARLDREGGWAGEVNLLQFGARKLPVRLTLSPLRDAEGRERAVVAVCRDLSDCLRLEENLRQAQKLEAVGLLASGLAHNINSPLAAIIVTAEMAQARKPEMREFRDIMQAAARIQEIIANLMTKSRQEQSTEETSIDLNQLVRTELKFLEANLFFKHQVELEVTLEPDLPKFPGLYGDFSQCFYNLVQNALDAMQETEDRRLAVRTGRLDGGLALHLTLSDTGCGIPEDQLHRIFEPFFTTKQENNHRLDLVVPSGTGLGLSTSARLMNKYGATLQVSSRVGAGSEFQIRIPLQRPDAE